MFNKLKDLFVLATFTYALTGIGKWILSIGKEIVEARKNKHALPHN